jgi:beta-glucosidase
MIFSKCILPATLVFLLFIALPVSGQRPVADSIGKKVSILLGRMTLDEKIGQLNQYNGFWNVTGPAPSGGMEKIKYGHFEKGMVGSVINVTGYSQVRALQQLAVSKSRLGIPLLFGFDVIHGYKTITPIPLAEASSWNLELIEASARMAAEEASAAGINWTFAPMVDICRDPRWGRVMEGSGEDPYLGGRIGAARVRGFQGTDLRAKTAVLATAKHFAGYGFSEGGRDYNTVDVSRHTLHNIILPPFRAAVDAGVATVMNSFNVLDGVPATGNAYLQKTILKGKWGFSGTVVSDWGSCGEMVAHGHAADLRDAAALALNAGSDVDMESYAYVTHLRELVSSGRVKVKDIDAAVSRVLRLKYALGLFDNPYKYCDSLREIRVLNSVSNRATALGMARQSIVLLKNDRKLLPLQRAQRRIAVIGELAADKNSPLGNWRLAAENNSAVSVWEGLQRYGGEIRFERGPKIFNDPGNFVQELSVNQTDTSGFGAALALAGNSELVVVVMGEHGYQSGEGRSRADIGLPGLQQRLLEQLYAVNPYIVLVLMNGRPLAIDWAAARLPAIVEAWQLGTESGNAIAEVLYGDYNPSGKLPMTFPASVGQIPLYYNHLNTGRPGPKAEVFWSHYTDQSHTPLYPFGFGLSYTDFAYSDFQVSVADSVTVRFIVRNTGSRDGEEVAQLYVRDLVAAVARPVRELKAFRKLMLRAGESATVEFVLPKQGLGYLNEQGDPVFEPGEFDFFVGSSSAAGLSRRVAVSR